MYDLTQQRVLKVPSGHSMARVAGFSVSPLLLSLPLVVPSQEIAFPDCAAWCLVAAPHHGFAACHQL